MKKVLRVLLVITMIIIVSGCGKTNKINYLEENWNLNNEIKPDITFERSKKNDSYGVFYVDSQIDMKEYINYLKKLQNNKLKVDWKYSDVDSIEKLESENTKILDDGYINFKMCNDEVCIFTQWVNKDTYNKLNKDKPTSYSFKLETEKLINEKESNSK